MKFIKRILRIESLKRFIYCFLYELLGNFSIKCGYGDPFNYSRAKEIYMSCILRHKIADTYSGADAINRNNEEVEYKSTISEKINATYNGVSVQKTWREQKKYLEEEKIGCYREHYFARFENNKIAELWKASGEQVLELLLPKFEKQWKRCFEKEKNKKDPRMGVSISSKEIKTIGKRII